MIAFQARAAAEAREREHLASEREKRISALIYEEGNTYAHLGIPPVTFLCLLGRFDCQLYAPYENENIIPCGVPGNSFWKPRQTP